MRWSPAGGVILKFVISNVEAWNLDPNAVNDDGLNTLHLALQKGKDAWVIETLIMQIPGLDLSARTQDSNRETPAEMAWRLRGEQKRWVGWAPQWMTRFHEIIALLEGRK